MSAPLRIAHFTVGRCNPDSANGIDKSISSLSRAQARLGHAVAVFSLTAKHPLPISGVEVYCHGYRDSGVAAPNRRLSVRRFTLPKRLVEHVLAWRPDLVHLHSVHVPENIALGAVLRRAGVPFGVSVHGGLTAFIRKRRRWTKLALKLIAEGKHLRSAAFLHAISGADAEGMREYGLSGDIAVVPNGIDLDGIPEFPDSHLLWDLYPAVRNKRVFAFLGRLDATVKGLDLLLHAFARASLPGAALVLIGPAERKQLHELQMLAHRLGIADSVVFTGPVHGELKFALLASADVFAHPSRTEGGVPFSVLEAAAMRKPCLVTPAADPLGAIVRYGGGMIVPALVSSIANAIALFSAMDEGQLAGMGAKARAMVEQEFNWTPIAVRMIECYQSSAAFHHV